MDFGGGFVRVIVECDFMKLFWKELDVDVVLECIGIFVSKEKVFVYFEVGVKCVLVFVLVLGVDFIVVYGINYDKLSVDYMVVLNVFCIINCLVLVVFVFNDIVGIECGYMIIVYVFMGD